MPLESSKGVHFPDFFRRKPDNQRRQDLELYARYPFPTETNELGLEIPGFTDQGPLEIPFDNEEEAFISKVADYQLWALVQALAHTVKSDGEINDDKFDKKCTGLGYRKFIEQPAISAGLEKQIWEESLILLREEDGRLNRYIFSAFYDGKLVKQLEISVEDFLHRVELADGRGLDFDQLLEEEITYTFFYPNGGTLEVAKHGMNPLARRFFMGQDPVIHPGVRFYQRQLEKDVDTGRIKYIDRGNLPNGDHYMMHVEPLPNPISKRYYQYDKRGRPGEAGSVKLFFGIDRINAQSKNGRVVLNTFTRTNGPFELKVFYNTTVPFDLEAQDIIKATMTDDNLVQVASRIDLEDETFYKYEDRILGLISVRERGNDKQITINRQTHKVKSFIKDDHTHTGIIRYGENQVLTFTYIDDLITDVFLQEEQP